MRFSHRIFRLLVLTFAPFFVFAQNTKRIDSLRSVLGSDQHDTLKISALNNLAKEYWLFKADSALPILQSAMQLAEKIDHRRSVSGTLLFEAYTYGAIEKYDSAIALYQKCVEYSGKNKFYKNQGQALTGIGNIYNTSGDYTKALPYYLQALKLLEVVKDSVAIAQVYNSLGTLFEYQGDYKQALSYHEKSLAIKLRKSGKTAIAMSYSNLGIVYSDLKDYQRSLENHLKSLSLREQTGNLNGMASCYVNIGNVYNKLGNSSEAIKYQLKAFDLFEQMNDQYGLTNSALNVGTEYGDQKKYDLARKYLLIAEEKVKKLNYKELELSIYHSLYGLYNNTGEYKKAFDYSLIYMRLKDSLFNESKAAELHKLNTVYQTEQKDRENKMLQKQNELSSKTIRQQEIIGYYTIGGLVLAILAALLIFAGYRQKKKANIIITKQKEEAQLQKAIIEEKNKEILDSIHYAKRIQQSLLPSERYVARHLERMKGKRQGEMS